MKIYYIDDEEMLGENFVDEFTAPEVEITYFSDPKEAIRVAAENPPELFFIDYRMPGVNGIELAAQLPEHTPKVLVTGDMSVGPCPGFVAVLAKPYETEEVNELIARFRG